MIFRVEPPSLNVMQTRRELAEVDTVHGTGPVLSMLTRALEWWFGNDGITER